MIKSKKMQTRVKKRMERSAGRVPNAATRRAIREARSGKNVESFASVKAWADEIRSV